MVFLGKWSRIYQWFLTTSILIGLPEVIWDYHLVSYNGQSNIFETCWNHQPGTGIPSLVPRVRHKKESESESLQNLAKDSEYGLRKTKGCEILSHWESWIPPAPPIISIMRPTAQLFPAQGSGDQSAPSRRKTAPDPRSLWPQFLYHRWTIGPSLQHFPFDPEYRQSLEERLTNQPPIWQGRHVSLGDGNFWYPAWQN